MLDFIYQRVYDALLYFAFAIAMAKRHICTGRRRK